jgi:tuftelin-interacting protein 11
LRLVVDASKADLDGLAREAKTIEERKKAIVLEELRLSKKVQEEANRA